jgi:DUF971 family protein
MLPLKLKLVDNDQLLIQWDDKTDSVLSLQKMRTFCPCATCVSNRLNQSKSYIPVLLSSQLEVAGIEIVGNYAIKIDWKDGHNTGIYEYSSLNKYIVDTVRA